MNCSKDNTQKCGWSLSTGRGSFLAGGSAIFVLVESGREIFDPGNGGWVIACLDQA